MFIPFDIETDRTVRRVQDYPIVVYGLLAIFLGVHVMMRQELTEEGCLDIFYRFGAVPFDFRWWTALTGTFLHGSYLHLVGNMYFLWVFGRNLERHFGSLYLAGLYISGAVFSTAIHILTISPLLADEPTIGASGAISAILGAFLATWPSRNVRCWFFSMYRFSFIEALMPSSLILSLWFGGQLVHTMQYSGTGNIAFWAHVAGFVAGTGLGTIMHHRRMATDAEYRRAHASVMTEAWSRFLRGQWAESGKALAQEDGNDDAACMLLKALLNIHRDEGGAPEQSNGLLRDALSQAREQGAPYVLVTAYLCLLRNGGNTILTADELRAAGKVAFELNLPQLGVPAFRAALAQAPDVGLEEMAEIVRGALPAAAEPESTPSSEEST